MTNTSTCNSPTSITSHNYNTLQMISPTSTTSGNVCNSISTIHQNIIEAHILTKLDGPTLASAACASTMLHTLCSQQKLWKDMCNSTWSSIHHPLIRHIISTFPDSYRSFFSDSFPATFNYTNTHDHIRSLPTSELISAVDIKYNNTSIFSIVEVTETTTDAFRTPPFWIDLLRPKESVPIPVKFLRHDEGIEFLEGSMSLSWIMIDPTRKRSANFSSLKPISSAGKWELVYATILESECGWFGSRDSVQCRITVRCGAEDGGEMQVKEVNMQVQDMDGVNLSGEDSLVIFQEAMRSQRKLIIGKEQKREMKPKFHVENIIPIVILICLISGILMYYV